MAVYFLCGIGGSGMMPLAQLLLKNGHEVWGSDRSRDQGKLPEKFKALEDMGAQLFYQDGTGVSEQIDCFVVSSAVEESIPDVMAALEQGLKIQKRAEVLSALFNAKKGLSVAGTSGKTTVTAMLGHVLSSLALEPTIVNGGMMLNFDGQGTVAGEGDYFVAETDESDGSILFFKPFVGILNNIALDHKPLDELKDIFKTYLESCERAVVVNADNDYAAKVLESASLGDKQAITFSATGNPALVFAQDIKRSALGTSFDLYVDGEFIDRCDLNVPGMHNIANALAVVGVCYALDLPLHEVPHALYSFKGTKRRLEMVGTMHNITVYDDFAHNPDKIAASLSTLREFSGRLLLFFQPHGFNPMKMMRAEMVESFVKGMGDDDILIMPEIYYAGGTVERSISSKDLIDDVVAAGKKARFFETRKECGDFLVEEAKKGDRIVIMGARDDTLTIFANQVLKALS